MEIRESLVSLKRKNNFAVRRSKTNLYSLISTLYIPFPIRQQPVQTKNVRFF